MERDPGVQAGSAELCPQVPQGEGLGWNGTQVSGLAVQSSAPRDPKGRVWDGTGPRRPGRECRALPPGTPGGGSGMERDPGVRAGSAELCPQGSGLGWNRTQASGPAVQSYAPRDPRGRVWDGTGPRRRGRQCRALPPGIPGESPGWNGTQAFGPAVRSSALRDPRGRVWDGTGPRRPGRQCRALPPRYSRGRVQDGTGPRRPGRQCRALPPRYSRGRVQDGTGLKCPGRQCTALPPGIPEGESGMEQDPGVWAGSAEGTGGVCSWFPLGSNFSPVGQQGGDKVVHDPREAHVFAPCPHHLPCPRLNPERPLPCNYLQAYQPLPFRWNPVLKEELFSFLILRRGPGASEEPWPRITQAVLGRARHVHCHLCCADGSLQHAVITARRHGRDLYRCARLSHWGDRLPVTMPPGEAVPGE
uniref:Uncharacterized protein n=1 Tax=Gopherus agassizii TaxID=38772 RepID=A0A452GW43_9SAUR